MENTSLGQMRNCYNQNKPISKDKIWIKTRSQASWCEKGKKNLSFSLIFHILIWRSVITVVCISWVKDCFLLGFTLSPKYQEPIPLWYLWVERWGALVNIIVFYSGLYIIWPICLPYWTQFIHSEKLNFSTMNPLEVFMEKTLLTNLAFG